jgi:hypothetical protein
MFTQKANSKQKRVKRTQKHETGYAVRGNCRENSIFHPKTQISSTQIPNLIGNLTYDYSTTWTSIIHKFNGFSTLLTTNYNFKT